MATAPKLGSAVYPEKQMEDAKFICKNFGTKAKPLCQQIIAVKKSCFGSKNNFFRRPALPPPNRPKTKRKQTKLKFKKRNAVRGFLICSFLHKIKQRM